MLRNSKLPIKLTQHIVKKSKVRCQCSSETRHEFKSQERSSNHLLNFFKYYFKYDLARRRAEPNGATRRATYGSLSSRFAMALICVISIAIAAQALIYSGLIFMSGKLFPYGSDSNLRRC